MKILQLPCNLNDGKVGEKFWRDDCCRRLAKSYCYDLVTSSSAASAAGRSDLMKKGLRLVRHGAESRAHTCAGRSDLMKKGLRHI